MFGHLYQKFEEPIERDRQIEYAEQVLADLLNRLKVWQETVGAWYSSPREAERLPPPAALALQASMIMSDDVNEARIRARRARLVAEAPPDGEVAPCFECSEMEDREPGGFYLVPESPTLGMGFDPQRR